MKATPSLPRRAPYADYLAAESHSESRHELIDGVIVAMAGGGDEHNAIAARLAGLVSAYLPRGGRSYSPEQRFWIAATARARYSDGSIICGKPAHPAHDGQATTNPLVVAEILSPSSEGDDDGDKRRDVIAAQDARSIKVYRRTDGGDWHSAPDVYSDGDASSFSSSRGPSPSRRSATTSSMRAAARCWLMRSFRGLCGAAE